MHKHRISLSSCLLNFSTWVTNKHLKFTIARVKLSSLPHCSKPDSLAVFHVPGIGKFHPSVCSGQKSFDSSLTPFFFWHFKFSPSAKSVSSPRECESKMFTTSAHPSHYTLPLITVMSSRLIFLFLSLLFTGNLHCLWSFSHLIS